MPTDEQAIRQLVHDWMSATIEHDIARIASLMTPDVVFLAAGHPPLRGRAQFLEGLQGMLGQVELSGSGDIQEIYISGDLAYCWNQLTVRVTPKSGGPAKQRAGHALSILRKQADGKWA